MSCPVGTDLSQAAAILRKGGLVAFATETVYGLGADALDPVAVAKIFDAKSRPFFDPIIAHVATLEQIEPLVVDFPVKARQLADRFWPGPLTLVLPKSDVVPDLLTAGLPSVAVRIPDHPLALQLLREVNLPVGAPSANLFGRLSPTCANDVAEQLGDNIDYILDGGPCRVGIESTVVGFPQNDENKKTGDQPLLLRPGGLPKEEIEKVVGPLRQVAAKAESDSREQLSPGMLPQHYAPRTPLVVRSSSQSPPPNKRGGLLTFKPVEDVSGFECVETLSTTGDLNEAATNFFAALRRLDREQIDLIVAESFPNHGLGLAMNDRLRRAAHR